MPADVVTAEPIAVPLVARPEGSRDLLHRGIAAWTLTGPFHRTASGTEVGRIWLNRSTGELVGMDAGRIPGPRQPELDALLGKAIQAVNGAAHLNGAQQSAAIRLLFAQHKAGQHPDAGQAIRAVGRQEAIAAVAKTTDDERRRQRELLKKLMQARSTRGRSARTNILSTMLALLSGRSVRSRSASASSLHGERGLADRGKR